MEDKERLAKLETHVEYLVVTLAKMEPKLDRLIEWRWKMWGVTAAIYVVSTEAFELMIAVIRHIVT